jgi:hypothetical protein
MDKLKVRSVKGDAGNEPLRSFCRVVFSIADHRMAQRGELRPDLILQSGHQLNPDERSIRKKAFHRVSKFGASRSLISCHAQTLKHSFPAKIVDERSGPNTEAAAQYREIPPHGSMGEKLPHQRVSSWAGLGKQQSPGDETIDAMHDPDSLSCPMESCD